MFNIIPAVLFQNTFNAGLTASICNPYDQIKLQFLRFLFSNKISVCLSLKKIKFLSGDFNSAMFIHNEVLIHKRRCKQCPDLLSFDAVLDLDLCTALQYHIALTGRCLLIVLLTQYTTHVATWQFRGESKQVQVQFHNQVDMHN